MPDLSILHQALIEYNEYILSIIHYIKYSNIHIENKHIELADLNFTFDKISFIINELNALMEKNILNIRIGDFKKYYKEYEVSEIDIKGITDNIRRINNRHYSLNYRNKKKPY